MTQSLEIAVIVATASTSVDDMIDIRRGHRRATVGTERVNAQWICT